MTTTAPDASTRHEDDTAQIAVENPATGEVIGHVPAVTRGRCRRARATRAGRSAGLGGARLRRPRTSLKRMQHGSMDNADRSIRTICSETGKAYEDAQIAETRYGAAAFGFWANAPRSTSQTSGFGRRRCSSRASVSCCGTGRSGSSGSSAPGTTRSRIRSATASLRSPRATASCSSPRVTPLTSMLLAEGLAECGLPDEVFLWRRAARRDRRAVINAVDMVMFTGSTDTGSKVAVRAAQRLIPASLELGGKDPMIVLADARRRASSEPRRVLLDVQLRTDVHLDRALLCRGPDLRRVRLKVVEKVKAIRQGAPPGRAASMSAR